VISREYISLDMRARAKHLVTLELGPMPASIPRIYGTSSRDLMTDMERDLGTKLDWTAVDHWNAEHPHVHVIVRRQGR
jgi:type IV secretory pathway VirD2 relaxase